MYLMVPVPAASADGNFSALLKVNKNCYDTAASKSLRVAAYSSGQDKLSTYKTSLKSLFRRMKQELDTLDIFQ